MDKMLAAKSWMDVCMHRGVGRRDIMELPFGSRRRKRIRLLETSALVFSSHAASFASVQPPGELLGSAIWPPNEMEAEEEGGVV